MTNPPDQPSDPPAGPGETRLRQALRRLNPYGRSTPPSSREPLILEPTTPFELELLNLVRELRPTTRRGVAAQDGDGRILMGR